MEHFISMLVLMKKCHSQCKKYVSYIQMNSLHNNVPLKACIDEGIARIK